MFDVVEAGNWLLIEDLDVMGVSAPVRNGGRSMWLGGALLSLRVILELWSCDSGGEPVVLVCNGPFKTGRVRNT